MIVNPVQAAGPDKVLSCGCGTGAANASGGSWLDGRGLNAFVGQLRWTDRLALQLASPKVPQETIDRPNTAFVALHAACSGPVPAPADERWPWRRCLNVPNLGSGSCVRVGFSRAKAHRPKILAALLFLAAWETAGIHVCAGGCGKLSWPSALQATRAGRSGA